MIGNSDDARFARELHKRFYEASMKSIEVSATAIRCVEEQAARKGWRRVGTGAYRSAYRSPEGVVYKVQSESFGTPNEDEHWTFQANRYASWSSETSLYYHPGSTKPVLAMPFIDGEKMPESRCTVSYSDDEHEWFDWDGMEDIRESFSEAFNAGIRDLHADNFRIVGRRIKVLDANLAADENGDVL